MKKRLLIAGTILAIGLFLTAYAATAGPDHWTLPIDNLLVIVAGVLLVIVAALLIVTEFFELMLTRGQRALVDGLQAG